MSELPPDPVSPKKRKKESPKDVPTPPLLPQHTEVPESLTDGELEAIIGEYDRFLQVVTAQNNSPWKLDYLIKEATNQHAMYRMEQQRRRHQQP